MTDSRDEAAAFRALASATVEDYLRNEPETATALGDHRFDDRLDDRSEAGAVSRRQVYERHARAVRALDTGALDQDDRADRAILLNALEGRIFAEETLADRRWDPLYYNPGNALYPLIARETTPVADRLRALASRLDQIPEVVDLARIQLSAPPLVHIETALQQNAGTVGLVRDEVARLVAQEPSMGFLVEPAQTRALVALDRHGVFLEELLAASSHSDFRLGPERFARKLELTLDSSVSAEEVLRRAHAHLDELTDQIEGACRAYLSADGSSGAGSSVIGMSGPDTVRAALDEIALRHPDNDNVVAEASDSLEQAVRMVKELGFVSVPGDAMVVQVMPEFRRGVAIAYCDAPGPLERGGETFLAVAPTPGSWPEERVDSFYREYNSAMIANLIVHEAMPGHALQLAHGRRFEGSTGIRRVFMSGSFIEGWAVHAERLMAEAGFGGRAVRLQQLKMQLRMTINAILDSEVHAGQMTEQAAMELMATRGFQEEGEAAGKWRRSCLTSAQLSTYFVGYSELSDVLAQLGSSQKFDAILSHGSPPPRLLSSLLNV
jgi:uncharacterized protein (DUF885 family)